jgi:alpha-L-arabinofuranosidase
MNLRTKLEIFPDVTLHKVNNNIYGQFIEHLGKCIYGGIWVGKESPIPNINGIRIDTIDALKNLEIPVLRYPGGCFADSYHWMDGIGEHNKRPKRLNIWWNQPEKNEFGTHEFMEFCNLIGTEPYICLNMGSGTIEEARSWVEYCNSNQDTTLVKMRRENGAEKPFNVKYWGVGNENWVCGGNMRPEYYADLYRRFSTYIRKTGGEDIKLIACGSYPSFIEWDERYLESMKGAESLVDFISLHIYTGWTLPCLEFTETEYHKLISDIGIMERNLKRAINLTEAYSKKDHKIGVIMDEWGTWYKEAVVENGLFQQNTLMDALFTAVSFHTFHNLGESLHMTNMAQTANVLQSLILTKGDQLIKTPTYHVFELFKPHRNSSLLYHKLEQPKNNYKSDYDLLSVSISKSENEIFVSLVNLDLEDTFEIELDFNARDEYSLKEIKKIGAEKLNIHNNFDEPENIKIENMKLSSQESNVIKIGPISILTLTFNKSHK